MKKNVIKRMVVNTILLMAVFLFCGCGQTKEEKTRLSVLTEQAACYMDEKYGGKHKVCDSYYFYEENTCFASRNTGDILIEFSDGTQVLYDGTGFYDDAQADEIISDLINEIWEPMTGLLGETKTNDSLILDAYNSWNTSYSRDKYYSVLVNAYKLDGMVQGFFFREYYDGNIENYIKNEHLTLETYLFHISTEEQWEKEVDAFEEEFYRVFGKQRDHYVSICSITKEHFYQYGDCEVGEEGFLARTSLENEMHQKTAVDYR